MNEDEQNIDRAEPEEINKAEQAGSEEIQEEAQAEVSAEPEESAADEDKLTKDKVLKEAVSWIETILGAIIAAFIITHVIVVNAVVPSASMETTIMTGDRLIANRLAYIGDNDPQRYDIVVFKFPDDESKLYIKRIIGLPGEKVEIKDGEVYINDSTEPLDSSFLHEPMLSQNAVYNVPEDCYFMMGDNRNNSADSRFWKNKFVERKKILGKAVFRYYPFDKMGAIGYNGDAEE